MASLEIRCPECDHRISLLRPVPAGKRMRCLSCGAVFPMPPTDFPEEPPSVLPARSRQRGRPEETDEEDLRGRPRRRRPPAKSNTRTVLFVLLGVGGVVVLFCGGLIAGVYWAVNKANAPTAFPEQTEDYADARRAFRTKLVERGPAPQEGDLEAPPPGVREVRYKSGNLHLPAWVSGPPAGGPGPRHPAVLFLHGGFAFGEEDWDDSQPFRDAGFVVMTPILRGENGQPGSFSLFYDEVDDVLAAAEELARLPYVDPGRLYVAGHSAGGTLALLAAMTSDRFKAAGSFSGSPDQEAFCRDSPELVPFDRADPREARMRSPLAFPRSFKCPVRIYYGSQEFFFRNSSQKTAELARKAGKDVEAVRVPGDHFTSLPPAMRQCISFFQQH